MIMMSKRHTLIPQRVEVGMGGLGGGAVSPHHVRVIDLSLWGHAWQVRAYIPCRVLMGEKV